MPQAASPAVTAVIDYPSFRQLPHPDGSGIPLARGVWGADDQIGTLNNITPKSVAAASALVRSGRRYNLNLPLHEPLGLLGADAHKRRRNLKQTLLRDVHSGLMIRDEKIDDFYTQASTQWDGLTHIGDPQYGFYNGVSDADVNQGPGTKNGIEHFSAHGIAARGVLVDLPRYFERIGKPWHPLGRHVATAADVAATLAASGIQPAEGDVLLVRTGWLRLFREADDAGREGAFRGRDYSGLSGDLDMWEYIWDNRFAAIASDAVAVETLPWIEGKPSLHLAIARLGLVLGELFDLEQLAEDAYHEKDATSFFVSVPLNLRGGVGSPGNAMALR